MDEYLEHSLAQIIRWQSSGNPFLPYTAIVDGKKWVTRLNNFPEQSLYTLIIGETEVGDFDDWPVQWMRPVER